MTTKINIIIDNKNIDWVKAIDESTIFVADISNNEYFEQAIQFLQWNYAIETNKEFIIGLKHGCSIPIDWLENLNSYKIIEYETQKEFIEKLSKILEE